MDKNLTISDASSLLLGAGLVKLDTIELGLTLIGVGVFLKVLVAILQKKGIDVQNQIG